MCNSTDVERPVAVLGAGCCLRPSAAIARTPCVHKDGDAGQTLEYEDEDSGSQQGESVCVAIAAALGSPFDLR